ncbi:MAG: DEAD/DEAH box helicase [Methyloversatilis sp.]|uniref:DEAD/DEAH box helicase n=1 Tax=Methyloversatilis sp. TaxID=2569862 RepID=UPI00273373E3|nr:DEAD/DEAH box helicase [Methyloversatilis sp.]MDP3873628.1 DEAD/DEAH box helicase [Methyloversatilis sp.]
MSFEELGLIPELLRAVADTGYTTPTPIQAQAIPIILAGRDVMGGAQTGTGKTAGFTLPLLQRLAPHSSSSPSPARHPVRALIVCPTRELAMQVHESVRTYSKHLPLRSVCIYGGVDMKAQVKELREGREIVVATPGRLLDHVEGKSIALGQVQMLVLDEADRMLDMGFIPDIKRILALLPAQRQSLLFSATFSEEIKKLAQAMLRDPQLIEVARRNATAETVTHKVHACATDDKRALLTHLLTQPDYVSRQALVFVNTKFGASRLAVHLIRQGVAADAIHGDKSQQQRTEALEAFKSGAVRVLVATDVAARGLDIEDLPFVINFELPHNAEDYVHRIGRTGRAGRSGEAISLMAPEERGRVADIEKLIRKEIEPATPEGFDPGRARQREARESSPREARGGERPRERAAASSGERPERPESAARRGRSSPGDAVRAPRSPRSSASQVAADGFDFSKPYESLPSGDGPAATADGTAGSARRGKRQVAALLGGNGKR